MRNDALQHGVVGTSAPHSMSGTTRLTRAVAATVAALALLAHAAPAADARKPAVEPPGDLSPLPTKPWEPPYPCICLPHPDAA